MDKIKKKGRGSKEMKESNHKPGSKEKKEGIMKTTILTLGMLVLFCMPQITSMAAAQGGNQGGFYTAMAISSLAEKEIREKEGLAAENCEIRTAKNTVVAGDADGGYLKERE
jgi:hypothetical protein